MRKMDRAFAALSDPTRRRIVARLAKGEATVSELVGQFDLTQPTISSHLKVLESAGLISRRRMAQTRPCRLDPDGLKAVTDWIGQVQQVWEDNYTRLDGLLAELKDEEASSQRKERR